MPFQDDTPIWAPVYRLEQTDQVLGGIPDRMTGAGKSNWPHEDLARRTAYLKQEIDYLSMTASVEVTVGAAGDFLTINEALAALSRRRQGYVRGGVSATVRLLAGFTMAEQVIVSGVNLGWITIVGDDPSTTINRAYLIDLIPGGAGYAAFSALEAGVLPKIGQLFGNRDHTTVMYANKKISELMKERRSIYNQVTELTSRIKQNHRYS